MILSSFNLQSVRFELESINSKICFLYKHVSSYNSNKRAFNSVLATLPSSNNTFISCLSKTCIKCDCKYYVSSLEDMEEGIIKTKYLYDKVKKISFNKIRRYLLYNNI